MYPALASGSLSLWADGTLSLLASRPHSHLAISSLSTQAPGPLSLPDSSLSAFSSDSLTPPASASLSNVASSPLSPPIPGPVSLLASATLS